MTSKEFYNTYPFAKDKNRKFEASHMIKFAEAYHKFKSGWVDYDFDNIETRPPKYGKYFIMRKDGKVHWETWNGSGWAYNENAIIKWKKIDIPKI